MPWYTRSAANQYEVAVANKVEDPHDIIIETAGLSSIPSVELFIEKDGHSGWNLFLATENFEFSPEHCGEEHMMGYGHAHLYINDQKVARLYSPWYHLADLDPGTYEFRVSLNGNNHGLYTHNGQDISALATVQVGD